MLMFFLCWLIDIYGWDFVLIKNVFIKMNLICFNILYERFFEYCFDVLVWFSYDVIIVIFEELFVLENRYGGVYYIMINCGVLVRYR